MKYLQQTSEKLPGSSVNANTSAKEILMSTAKAAKEAVIYPARMAGDVVEKVSDKIVKVATTTREVLRGKSGVKEVAKNAVDSAKDEVKGVVEQAKKM